MKYIFRRLIAVTALAVFISSTADAAAVRSGGTVAAWTALSRGSAVAYDSTNHVYLVVSTFGTLRGRFVSPSGAPLGNPFVIQGSRNFTHFPRLAFSADADGGSGGFLVSWHESDLPGGSTSIHARIVSYTKNGPAGADTVLATDGSWWESGAAVAYATVSKEFLVVFPRVHAATGYGIRAVRVDNQGAARGPVFTIAISNQYEDNPSVGYNPTTDQFLVAYSGYNPTSGFAYIDARLVQAGANQLVGSTAIRLTATAGTWITDVTYNPGTNQFFVAWYSASRAGSGSYGRLVAADGSLVGNVIVLSTRWKANDGLSVAYNTRANTMLLVANSPTSAEVGGVEIGANGNPVDNGFQVTVAGGTGNFYPRVSASADDPNWLVSAANSFTSTIIQLVSGTVDPNAPAGPGTPTQPPPSGPAPLMNVDSPGNATSVSSAGFQVAGWAIDRGAPSGTGVDAIHVYAWPVTGASPTFLGAATYGIARPDVGGFYGSGFTGSGFSLLATGLAPGTYDIAVYAHSTVSGKFDGRVSRVTVTAPVSIPRMWIDTPAKNQTTSQNLSIAGWAVDLAAGSTSGVDAIHIYAYAAGSSSPIWLGAAVYGQARPDVGGAFGGSRFNASGFRLDTTALAPGGYTLVVFAHSSVTGTFNNAQTVAITVR